MKRPHPVAALGAWLALALGPAPAAAAPADSAATATITGRVQNVVTGQYLHRARVTVRGTAITVFTDEYGTYRIAQAPAGRPVLDVFYTDLDPQDAAVEVAPGASVERNFELTSVARYGRDAAVVKLDPYVVSSDKETDAQAAATNEQRFAPNLKNVMSTDALGVIMVGSVGEFLKFIPGVVAEYDNADVLSLSVRGIGGAMTSVSTDGAQMVNANSGNTRRFQVRSLTLNEISRVEVTKVPTPSSPADSMGGSINLIRKSAFERSVPEFRYGVILVGNSENLTLRRLPRANGDKRTYHLLPGFEFDYTRPIGKNFGLVIAGTHGNKFNEQHFSRNTYNTGGTSTGASAARPFLQSHLLFDGPRNQVNQTLSIKADWRVAPHSVLSVGGLYNPQETVLGNLQLTSNAGTNGTPTPANGVPLSFGPDFTVGATGRGGVTNANINRVNEGVLRAGDVKFRYDDGTWLAEAAYNRSGSYSKRNNFDHGHFNALNAQLAVPVRVSFTDNHAARPGNILVFDNNNSPVDLYNIDNYRVTTANDIPFQIRSSMENARVSLRRRLNLLPFAAALEVGGSRRVQTQDRQETTLTWNYNGPDGNPNTLDDQGARALQMQVYVNQDSAFGFRDIPWVSSSRGFAAWRANPALFSQTPAQVVAAENSRLQNSEYLRETVRAAYLQAEAAPWQNRLKIVTGVRFEETRGEGQGALFDPNAVFTRGADGSFARNAQGARIRRPDAGAAGSLEELRLTRRERAARANRTYDGFYPSLHFTLNLRENLLVRAAYARTYGRPDFDAIIPNVTINENDLSQQQLADPSVVRGTLTARNPSLRPWTAHNYDFSVEYYTDTGGLLSAGVFWKDIRDFFGESVRLATTEDLEAVGLDGQYAGWNLATMFNAGDARISGGEVNFRHSLRGLGRWGSHFTVFANATQLRLEGEQQSSFASFIPLTGNWGVSFNRQKLSLTARWNYRDLDKRGAQPAFGPDAFEYYKARTTLDANFTWQFTRRLSLVGSVNNLTNVPQTLLRYGAATPGYAQQFQISKFGSAVALGLKGSF